MGGSGLEIYRANSKPNPPQKGANCEPNPPNYIVQEVKSKRKEQKQKKQKSDCFCLFGNEKRNAAQTADHM